MAQKPVVIAEENFNPEWFVYLVRCNDTTLYCGISNNVARRIWHHNNSKRGARYTATRRPVFLVYKEGAYSKKEAMRREREIKSMSKKQKESLIP